MYPILLSHVATATQNPETLFLGWELEPHHSMLYILYKPLVTPVCTSPESSPFLRLQSYVLLALQFLLLLLCFRNSGQLDQMKKFHHTVKLRPVSDFWATIHALRIALPTRAWVLYYPDNLSVCLCRSGDYAQHGGLQPISGHDVLYHVLLIVHIQIWQTLRGERASII